MIVNASRKIRILRPDGRIATKLATVLDHMDNADNVEQVAVIGNKSYHLADVDTIGELWRCDDEV